MNIDIKDKILNTKFSEKATDRMFLFVGFAIPAISSLLYYGLTTITTISDIISLIWAVATGVIWFIYTRKISKRGIAFKRAFFGMHWFMLFSNIFSIAAAILWPDIPGIVKNIALTATLYLVCFRAISVAPVYHIANWLGFFDDKAEAINNAGAIFGGVEHYYRWMFIVPVVASILLMAIFVIAFKGEDD